MPSPPPHPPPLSDNSTFNFPPPSSSTLQTFSETYSRLRRSLNEERERLNASREATRELRRRVVRNLRENNSRLQTAWDAMNNRRRRRLDPRLDASTQSPDASNTESPNSRRRLPALPSAPLQHPTWSPLYPRNSIFQPPRAVPSDPRRGSNEGSFARARHRHQDTLHRLAMFARQRDANNALQGSGQDSDADVTFRRRKKRKIMHDIDVDGYDPVSYGWKGQVDPGHLRLEILSCDGGEIARFDHYHYRAENILRNDRSVYCSKSSKCNLLFRHQAETIFHLDSLVIKAPESGFTAPNSVQQGLVFVGMNKEDLIKAASSYGLGYGKDISRGFHLPFDHRNRSTAHVSFLSADVNRRQRARGDMDIENYHAEFDPDFMSLDSDRTEDEDNVNNPSNMGYSDVLEMAMMADDVATRVTRGPIPAPDSSSDSDIDFHSESLSVDQNRAHLDELQGLVELIHNTATSDRNPAEMNELNQQIDQLMETMSASRRTQILRGETIPGRRETPGRYEVRDQEGTERVLEPDANFWIPQTQSKIILKFKTPLAGKYILLKLFSPHNNERGNIDIQYVAGYGYSGPRYIPAFEMR